MWGGPPSNVALAFSDTLPDIATMPTPTPARRGTVGVSPRSGARVVGGANPGNKGGAKGRSGRRPNKWGDFIAELRESDEGFRAAIRTIAHDPDSRNFGHLLKLVREYDPEAPERRVSVDLTVTGVIALPVLQRLEPPASLEVAEARVLPMYEMPPAVAALRQLADG